MKERMMERLLSRTTRQAEAYRDDANTGPFTSFELVHVDISRYWDPPSLKKNAKQQHHCTSAIRNRT